jgi:hypothetical protein
MTFSKEVADNFETLSEAFISFLKGAPTVLHPNTSKTLSIDNLWDRTWKAAEAQPC